MRKNLVTKSVAKMLRNSFTGNETFTDTEAKIIKAVSNPADSVTSGWAADLMQNEYMPFVQDLSDRVAYAALLPYQTPAELGRTNSLIYAKRNKTKSLGGDWIEEGAAIPVSEGEFVNGNIPPKKLGSIVSFTREVAQKSDIETILEEAIASDLHSILDTKFFSSDVGTPAAPEGIGLNAIETAVTTAGTKSTANEILDAIAALYGKVASAGLPLVGSWILNVKDKIYLSNLLAETSIDFRPFKEDLKNNMLEGNRVLLSDAITEGEMLFIADNALAMSGINLELSLSSESTLVMSNPADDDIGTTTNPVRSLYQTDTKALKLTAGSMGWAAIHQDGVAKITGLLK